MTSLEILAKAASVGANSVNGPKIVRNFFQNHTAKKMDSSCHEQLI